MPGIAAIRQARRALEDVGKSGDISLVYAGGIRNGGDVAKALALGADAVAIGHSSMMALNCNKDIPEADFPNEMGVKPAIVITAIPVVALSVLRLKIQSYESDWILTQPLSGFITSCIPWQLSARC